MKRITASRLARVIARYRRRKDQRALHVQIDDGNLDHAFFDDGSIASALSYGDHSGARLLRLMRRMTRTQRIKAVRLSW